MALNFTDSHIRSHWHANSWYCLKMTCLVKISARFVQQIFLLFMQVWNCWFHWLQW